MIRDIVETYITEKSEERSSEWMDEHEPGYLFPSDIGGCPLKAWHNCYMSEKTHPFPLKTLEIFRCGILWENETYRALSHVLGDSVKQDVSVKTGMWSGRMDFLVEPCDGFPDGAIIEHKATNPQWNFRSGRLPYRSHVLQVLLYRYLYGQIHGVGKPAYLYYRGWNHWCELQIVPNATGCSIYGSLDGKEEIINAMDFDLVYEIEAIQSIHHYEQAPPVPYGSPVQEDFRCTRSYRGNYTPICSYYGHCWKDWPQKGWFDEEGNQG